MNASSLLLLAEANGYKSRNKRVGTREYRLALDPECFSPFQSSARDWVEVVAREACREGMRFVVSREPFAYRRSWYLDTVDLGLRRNFLSLRVHEERVHDMPFRIELSGSHQDRYLAALCGVSARGKSRDEFKEEVARNGSVFVSLSQIRRRKLPRLHYIQDLVRYFPGTGRCFDVQDARPIAKVDGAVSSDLVHRIGHASFANAPSVMFEITASYLGTWRLGRPIGNELEKHTPDAVEFSFRYDSLPAGSDLERFPCENIVMGRRLFDVLSTRRDWLDHSGTGYPYDPQRHRVWL